jgi:hypothetical protein
MIPQEPVAVTPEEVAAAVVAALAGGPDGPDGWHGPGDAAGGPAVTPLNRWRRERRLALVRLPRRD